MDSALSKQSFHTRITISDAIVKNKVRVMKIAEITL